MPVPILETERITLREIRMSDAENIFNYKSNADNAPHTHIEVHNTIEDTYKFIEKMNAGVENKEWLIWMIELSETSECIGIISLWNFNFLEESAETGYDLFPKFRGNGYASEAIKLVCDIGLIDLNLRFVDACTSHDNQASIKILKNLGFVYVKSFIAECLDKTQTEMHVYRKPKN